MNKKLLIVMAFVLGIVSQADATSLKEYVALRGGYSAMKHRSRERSNDSVEIPKYNWNGGTASGSVAYGLKAGYLRLEAEGNLNSSAEKRRNFYSDDGKIESTVVGKIKTSSVLFNSYLELPVNFPIKPYIGGGIGMAHIKAQFKDHADDGADKTKISGNHFAWQIGAGLSCEITPEWAVDMGYRFMDFGNVLKKTNIPEDGTFYSSKLRVTAKSHNAYVGVRYMF